MSLELTLKSVKDFASSKLVKSRNKNPCGDCTICRDKGIYPDPQFEEITYGGKILIGVLPRSHYRQREVGRYNQKQE